MTRIVRVRDQVTLVLAGGESTQATVVAVTDQNDVDLEFHHHAAAGDLITAITGAVRATGFPASGVLAQGTLTLDTEPINGDTYTIGSKVYTFETSLTDVDGNVNIGGTLAQAKLNLVSAIDLSGVAGTDYADAMSANTDVTIAAFISDDAILSAILGGTAGNLIATTESFDAGTNIFDAAVLGTTTPGVENWYLYN